MARPRGQTRPGREVVLEAAIVLFAERGFHGTSMRDVAAAAGMTVAGIYHHFSSKQEILRGLMVATMIDVLEATAAALDAAGSTPQDRLGALVEAWVLFHTQRQAEALIGASELRSLDDEGHSSERVSGGARSTHATPTAGAQSHHHVSHHAQPHPMDPERLATAQATDGPSDTDDTNPGALAITSISWLRAEDVAES